MKVSGSILCDKVKDAVKMYDKTSIDFIHLDIMDGKFVSNKTFTMGDINAFSKLTTKSFDVHLMVNNPDKYIDDLSMYNTSYITFHLEAVKKPMDVINHIKGNGIKVGVAIKPGTKVSDVFPLLPYIDLVLVMTVEPGKSGQAFMESNVYKVEALKKEIREKGYNIIVSADGGINDTNINLLKEKDIDMVVSASYLLSGNAEEKINILKQA